MQYSIIRLSQCSEEERLATVSDDCQLMVGSASASDLRLHVSFGLPDECLKIRVENGLCIAENLTGDPGLVFVNGQQVFGIMQLDDGDALQIGSDQFAVVFGNEQSAQASTEEAGAKIAGDEATVGKSIASPVASPKAEQRSEEPAENKTDALKNRVLNTAVTIHQPANEPQFENVVLADLCRRHGAFLLANFKVACVEDPGIRIAGEDLLENLPKTIRSHESLHAVVNPDSHGRQELWQQLRGRDAAVWCFPESDVHSCLLDIKLYAAWFVRPSVLEMALQNNSSEFGNRILKSFRMLVLKSDGDQGAWHLYTKPNLELDRSSSNALFVDV